MYYNKNITSFAYTQKEDMVLVIRTSHQGDLKSVSRKVPVTQVINFTLVML